jgi:hypothetical protein
VYRAAVPIQILSRPKTVVRFELDQAVPPDSRDRRERGIVALSVGFH